MSSNTAANTTTLTPSIPHAQSAAALYDQLPQVAASASTISRNIQTGNRRIDTDLGLTNTPTNHLVGLACESSDTCTTILLHILATHLLTTNGPAFYISTPTHALPLSRLHALLHHFIKSKRHNLLNKADPSPFNPSRSGFGRYEDLLSRVEVERAAFNSAQTARNEEDDSLHQVTDEDAVTKYLDRVSLMQVFDLHGAMESVSEIASSLTETHNIDTPLVIIPSLPSLVTPVMRADHLRGHALLLHLLRHIRALAAAHGLVCVLGNSTVGSTPDSLSSASSSSATPKNLNPSPSAFASAAHLRPALGRTLAYTLDLSLMVHSQVRGLRKKKSGCTRHVIEILKSRHALLEGRWSVIGTGALGVQGVDLWEAL